MRWGSRVLEKRGGDGHRIVDEQVLPTENTDVIANLECGDLAVHRVLALVCRFVRFQLL